jgi:hypothetical protein
VDHLAWRKFLYGLWRIALALIMLLGVVVFPVVGLEIFKQAFPIQAYLLISFGPRLPSQWLIFLGILFWYPAALAAWVARDATKSKPNGAAIWPILWAVGTILPTIVIVLPLYMIRRKIIWTGRQTATVKTDFLPVLDNLRH